MPNQRPVSTESARENNEYERASDESKRVSNGGLPPLTAAQAGRYGLEQIAELTGKEPEGVTGVEPAEDGWEVTVEVVEDRRIPSSSDILSMYRTDINPDGELVSYQRIRRYARGRGDGAT